LKALHVYIRFCYFLVILISLCGIAFFAVELLAGVRLGRRISLSDSYVALMLVAFVIPCSFAIIRKIRRRPLTIPPRDTESSFYWGIVTVAATIGHASCALGATVLIDWIGSSREAPKQVFLLVVLSAALYLIALWIAEFVLMRRTTRLTTERPS
jgi:hypothetical protein